MTVRLFSFYIICSFVLSAPLAIASGVSQSQFAELWNSKHEKWPYCPRALARAVFEQGARRHFWTRRGFVGHATALTGVYGLEYDLVLRRYNELSKNQALTDLMYGFKIADPKQTLHVTGGWAQDQIFVRKGPLIPSLKAGLPVIQNTYEKKLGLPDGFLETLFESDRASVPDSGWVLVHSKKDKKTTFSSVKVTFYDLEMTPDGPYARYAFHHPMGPVHYSYELAGENVPTDWQVTSSLQKWGLFPLEKHTGMFVPEHDGESWAIEQKNLAYSLLFSPAFERKHHALMYDVIHKGARGYKTYEALGKLLDWRKENIPKKAFEVAELGRLTNNHGIRGHVQLSHGLLALLVSRPIQTCYLEAPIGEKDQHRIFYKRMKFKVVETFPAGTVPGVASGVHVMRAQADEFLEYLFGVVNSESNQKYLSENQRQSLAQLRKRIDER